MSVIWGASKRWISRGFSVAFVEVELDGQSMGYAGKGAQLAEALSLDPQSIVDRSNKGASAQ